MEILKTHCKRGHRLTNKNVYIRGNGWKCCAVCNKNRGKKWAKENKERLKFLINRMFSEKPWTKTFYNIQIRCERPEHNSYKRYGGNGIKCLITKDDLKKIWFRDKAYLLKRPSIDRIDSNGNYEYSNCRYIELSENSRLGGINKRRNKKP